MVRDRKCCAVEQRNEVRGARLEFFDLRQAHNMSARRSDRLEADSRLPPRLAVMSSTVSNSHSEEAHPSGQACVHEHCDRARRRPSSASSRRKESLWGLLGMMARISSLHVQKYMYVGVRLRQPKPSARRRLFARTLICGSEIEAHR